MKILLVEDDEDIREGLILSLENLDCEVISAKDGDEGWNKFKEYKNELSAVITDNDMPGKSGLELIRLIRQDNKLPILMITGGSVEQEEAKLAGASLLYQKPFPTEDLEIFIVQVQVAIHARSVRHVV